LEGILKRLIIISFIVVLPFSIGLAIQSNAADKVFNKSNKTSKTPIYSEVPFSLNGKSIPKGYAGHDLFKIYKKLKERQDRKKKEFETTDEFNSRIERESKIPLFGKIYSGDKLALKANSKSIYDADRKILSIRLSLAYSWNHNFNMGVHGQRIKEYDKKYIGSNAFGATKEITEEYISDTILIVKNYAEYDVLEEQYLRNKYLQIELNEISREVAKKLKGKISTLYVFDIIEPFSDEEKYYDKATMDNPLTRIIDNKLVYGNLIEIILYNTQTGEIIYKLLPQPTKLNG
jgi:hypothetical protein